MTWQGLGAAIFAIAAAALVVPMAPAAAQSSQNCGSTANCSDNARRYEVYLHCEDAVVSNPETGDTLTLTAWDGDKFMGLTPWTAVGCNHKWYNGGPVEPVLIGAFDRAPTHFILETDGNDAFFADWIQVDEVRLDLYGKARETTKIAQYGGPEGRGYCLSRDPGDHSGDWAAASDDCDDAIKLSLTNQAVYGATPTELAYYVIGLDCVHPALGLAQAQALPSATISIAAYDSSGRVVAEHVQPHRQGAACRIDAANIDDPYDQAHGLEKFIARDVAAIEIAVGPVEAGTVATYFNARLFVDQLALFKNYIAVRRWDVDGVTGLCLSQYPDIVYQDGALLALAAGGCQPGMRFDVATGTSTPLK